MNIDIRTVIFLNVLIFITCTIFVVHLWLQNRLRYDGIGFWVIDFLMQTTALILIVLRGVIPDWMSMILSNSLIIAGCILIYIGLSRFLNKKTYQIHNYLFLVISIVVLSYYSIIRPSLEFRILIISIGMLFICFQCFWLLLFRVDQDMRPLTFWVSIAFFGYCVINIIRIVEYFVGAHTVVDYFQSGIFQALVLVSYLILFIVLIYSLIIMVNKRLLIEIANQEEKFAKAFHSAPYAITLTNLSDGTIFDVNEKFVTLTGYGMNEVIEHKTTDIHLWENDADRDIVVGMLSKNIKVHEMDLRFRKKNGESIIGLFSAEIIFINGKLCVLSSIGDITERKYAEEKVKSLLEEKELLLKEVHHRIKNNIASIEGLLSLQADDSTNIEVKSALQNAISHVQSMRVLYDKLLLSENYREVSIKDYIESLINSIVVMFPDSGNVTIEKKITDFNLNTNQLEQIGMAMNEILTNAFKYAFKGRDNGHISIIIEKTENLITLTVQDNGVGLSDGFDLNKSSGFGSTILRMLSTSCVIENNNGIRSILQFEI